MVFGFLKRLFGKTELSAYERQVLEREHRKVSTKIARKKDRLSRVETTQSKKKMNPAAKKLLGEIDSLEKELKEIEKQLGGKPEGGKPSRRSKRS